jgi:hypothetical protein
MDRPAQAGPRGLAKENDRDQHHRGQRRNLPADHPPHRLDLDSYQNWLATTYARLALTS